MTKEEKKAYDAQRRAIRVDRQREARFVAKMKALAEQPPPVVYTPEPMVKAAAPAAMPTEEERRAKYQAGRANIDYSEQVRQEFDDNLRRTDPAAWAREKMEAVLFQPGVLQQIREEYDIQHAGDESEGDGTIESMPGYAEFFKTALELNAKEQAGGA